MSTRDDLPQMALSIKQPWATLILLGLKTIEIRRWTTPFRGRIFIHAGKIADDRPEGWARLADDRRPLADLRGGIVGAVDLVECLSYGSADTFLRDRQLHCNEPSWFRPPRMFGFRFERPEFVSFVPCLGQVKLFPVAIPKPKKRSVRFEL